MPVLKTLKNGVWEPVSGMSGMADYAKKSELPTKVSQLENDKGYLTDYTETDPTVPSWAKSENKPKYTAEEVGADAYGTANTVVSDHNANTSTHNDIRILITNLTNRLNTLANSDDTTLDQMSEIVAYIKSNKSLIEGITTNKVNVSDIINNLTTDVTNKPLSASQGVALKCLIDALTTEVNKRALASDLTTHTDNTTIHITSDERNNWNAAKTHADSTHVTSVNGMIGDVEITNDTLGAQPKGNYALKSDIGSLEQNLFEIGGIGIYSCDFGEYLYDATEVSNGVNHYHSKPIVVENINEFILGIPTISHIAFYNSKTQFDNSTFITGLPSGSGNITVPDGALTCIISCSNPYDLVKTSQVRAITSDKKNCILDFNFNVPALANKISDTVIEGGLHNIYTGVAYHLPFVLENKKVLFSENIHWVVFATARNHLAITVYYTLLVNNGTLTLFRFNIPNGASALVPAYSFATIDISYNSFEAVINAISIELGTANTLIMNYVYEGESKSLAITIPEFNYLELQAMHFDIGTIVHIQDLPAKSAFFENYEEYFKFIQDYKNNTKILSNSKRIEVLESSGGSGETSVVDWNKGMDLLTFGQEYLYNILNKIASGSTFNVVFTGDSTTQYYANTIDGLETILKDCFEKAGITTGTYTNRGVSGINATQWKDSYLSGDIALAPDLYVIRHGFNNCEGSTLEEMASKFEDDMRTALATIRSTLPINQCSIVLMTPNSSNDDINNRGYSMKKLIDPIVRKLAREFGCGFIDTFRIWYDAGEYLSNMYDDPYGDGRHIHPNGIMNRLFMSTLFDFVCPIAYRKQ